MYSNGLVLSQAPTVIAGYPNTPCAYFADYTSFAADPSGHHLMTNPLNGQIAYATTTAQTGQPQMTNHPHHQNPNSNANVQYTSTGDGQQPPTLYAPISDINLNGQPVYGFAPISRF